MKKKLALGVLMGCLITGNMAWAADIVSAPTTTDMVIVDKGSHVINDDIFYSKVESNKDNPVAVPLYALNGGQIDVNSRDITLSATEHGSNENKQYAYGAAASQKGILDLGNEKTENIKIDVKGSFFVLGLYADIEDFNNKKGGTLNVTSKNLSIDVHATGDGRADGIYAITRTTNSSEEDKSKVVIDADNTVINVTSEKKQANGITAWSEGRVFINKGNVSINAENIINTRGHALVEINKNNVKDYVVQLNGDIVFEFNKTQSGTTINSDIVINLSNKDSYFNGNIGSDSVGDEDIPDGKDTVDGMQLGLSNGGTWNTDGNSFVNNLTFNDGVINVNGGADQKIQIDNVAGSGGDINIKGELDNGVWKLGEVVLGKDDNSNVEGKIDLNLSGVTADDIEDSKAALDALAGSLSVKGNDDKLDATGNIQEGLISGGISSDLKVDENGVVSVDKGTVQQGTSTTTMDSMRDIASVAIAAWRQEDSSLGQRLGELRSSEGDQGIWTRMSRGEFEYNDNFKNQYNFFQLGYDKAYGDWHYGAAISHNDGKTSYANGSGENSSLSLSLYGTWLGNDGEYADIVLKQGRLSNEFDIATAAGRTVGDYDMWGTSLSGEYGKEIKLNDGWYVTPQGQLTLMYVGGEDYTTSNGIMAEQDSMTSLVGRVGFEMGKAVNDKGRIFAKASLLHDFNGEADTRLSLGDKHNSYTQDLGKTWYEAGIGVSYKVSKASYIYADVMKTFGGDLETPWQWNAGVRYSF